MCRKNVYLTLFAGKTFITADRSTMSRNMALDLMLRTLMNSREFRETDKNWEAVAKLIPGSTSQQVSTEILFFDQGSVRISFI